MEEPRYIELQLIAKRQVKLIIAECQLFYGGGDFFRAKQCQGSKHSAAHIYPNICRVPPPGLPGPLL